MKPLCGRTLKARSETDGRHRGSHQFRCAGGSSHIEIRPGWDMKVNVQIDCTSLEARQFIGLPDVAPMQIAVMDQLQQQMMANIDKASPEALMQSWFTFDPKLAETLSGPVRRHHGRPRRYAHQQRQEIGMRRSPSRRSPPPSRAGFRPVPTLSPGAPGGKVNPPHQKSCQKSRGGPLSVRRMSR